MNKLKKQLLTWCLSGIIGLFGTAINSCDLPEKHNYFNPEYEETFFDGSQGYAPKIEVVMHGNEFNSITLKTMKQTGFKIVKTPIKWSDTNINESKWESDNLFEKAIENDFYLDLVISNTPDELSISRGDGLCNPPKNPADIWEFAYAVAERYSNSIYGNRVNSYSIYAEFNTHGDSDGDGCAFEPWRYYLTFIYATDAIKSADPKAVVVFGGLANSEDRYLRKIYEINELLGQFFNETAGLYYGEDPFDRKDETVCDKYAALLGDICHPNTLEDLARMGPNIMQHYDKMCIHNYLAWNDPYDINSECGGPRWYDGSNVRTSMEDMVCIFDVMDYYGDRDEYGNIKGVYITEFGWSTINPDYIPPGTDSNGINRVINQPNLTEEVAAIHFSKYLARLLTESKFKHIKEMRIYEFINPLAESYEENIDRENNFGQLYHFTKDETEVDYIIKNFAKSSYQVLVNYKNRYEGKPTPIEGMTAEEIIEDLLMQED